MKLPSGTAVWAGSGLAASTRSATSRLRNKPEEEFCGHGILVSRGLKKCVAQKMPQSALTKVLSETLFRQTLVSAALMQEGASQTRIQNPKSTLRSRYIKHRLTLSAFVPQMSSTLVGSGKKASTGVIQLAGKAGKVQLRSASYLNMHR